MQHHEKRAIQKGAKIEIDTVYKRTIFERKGVEVKFIPRLVSTGKPMIFIKDSVITKVKIIPGVNHRDTIKVETKCPGVRITKIVPVAVNKTIQAGKSFWFWLQWILVALVVGIIIGYIIRNNGGGVSISIPTLPSWPLGRAE